MMKKQNEKKHLSILKLCFAALILSAAYYVYQNAEMHRAIIRSIDFGVMRVE